MMLVKKALDLRYRNATGTAYQDAAAAVLSAATNLRRRSQKEVQRRSCVQRPGWRVTCADATASLANSVTL